MTPLQIEMDSAVRPLGNHAALYCGACDDVIPYGSQASGPVEGWPYCPVHKDRPLVVRAVTP